MAEGKAICPCCNGNIDIVNGKLIGHDRTETGYCEGSNKTPDELRASNCSYAKNK